MSKSYLLRFAIFDSGNQDENYWTWKDEALPKQLFQNCFYDLLRSRHYAGIAKYSGKIIWYRYFDGGLDPQKRQGRAVLVTAWLLEKAERSTSPNMLLSILNADFWNDFISLANQNPVPTPEWGTQKIVEFQSSARYLSSDLKDALTRLFKETRNAHLSLEKAPNWSDLANFSDFNFFQSDPEPPKVPFAPRKTSVSKESDTAAARSAELPQKKEVPQKAGKSTPNIETTQNDEPTQNSQIPDASHSNPPRRHRKAVRPWVIFGILGLLISLIIIIILGLIFPQNPAPIDTSNLNYPNVMDPHEEQGDWSNAQLQLRQEIRGWKQWCQELTDNANLVIHKKASESTFFENYPMFSGKTAKDAQLWGENQCSICNNALHDMEVLSDADFRKKYDSFLVCLKQSHSETYRRVSSQLESRRQALEAMEADFRRVGRDLTLEEFMRKYPEL